MFKNITIFFVATVLLGGGVAAQNQGNNTTTSFEIENNAVDSSVSVNQFGENIANISSKYMDNKTGSRTFTVKLKGNITEILDAPNQFTLFNNESNSFPLVANVPLSQGFGVYNGTLKMTDDTGLNDSVNVSVKVVDDVNPEMKTLELGDVQATENQEWVLNAEDNIKVVNVSGKILREVEEQRENKTVKVNQTFKEEIVFQNQSDGTWTYNFTDTDNIGQYYLNISASDASGNGVFSVTEFQVTGLDSVEVVDSNFVFDTIRPKEDTRHKVVSSSIEGKPVKFSLKNLSYGGNETVRIGVFAPDADSPEVLDEEAKVFTAKGSYDLVMLHSGSNEVKGVHRVTGEVVVEKPEKHVEPVSEVVAFSGSVKNLDKPPETCTRVEEFDACIGYSFDSAQSLFEDNYGDLNSPNKSRIVMISWLPTSEVEGSSEWRQSTSLTLGEYNETLDELDNVTRSRNDWRSKSKDYEALLLWIPFLLIGVGGGTVFWWIKIGQFVSIAQNGRRMIEKAKVVDPEEGLK